MKIKRTSLLLVVPTLLFFLATSLASPSDSASLKGKKRDAVIATALSLLGQSYEFGGSGKGGFDCSGFVMYVYQKNGIPMARTAKKQFHGGNPVERTSLKPGDLVFFIINEDTISHVGIYLGAGKFIHAPSKGKNIEVSSLSNSYWKKHFAGAVTYIEKKKEVYTI